MPPEDSRVGEHQASASRVVQPRQQGAVVHPITKNASESARHQAPLAGWAGDRQGIGGGEHGAEDRGQGEEDPMSERDEIARTNHGVGRSAVARPSPGG